MSNLQLICERFGARSQTSNERHSMMVSAFKRIQDVPFPTWTRKILYRWLMGAEVCARVTSRVQSSPVQSSPVQSSPVGVYKSGWISAPREASKNPTEYDRLSPPTTFDCQILGAIIVLGTSAAVVSGFSTWSSCTTTTTASTVQFTDCIYISSSPQGYINIALCASIIGFLFIGTLAMGEYVVHVETAARLPVTASRPGLSSTPSSEGVQPVRFSMARMDQKVLLVSALVFYPILWVFWITGAVTTTILCSDVGGEWGTLNAACAFTWWTWVATTGSCYIVGKEAWEGRSGGATGDDRVGDERSRGKVAVEASDERGNALRSSRGSGRVGRSGTAAMAASTTSAVGG